ncbi:MFS transporter [Lentinula detonsa]|uniref:MFS transporter n=1 Tax=Lentinula detonsa TaxID=2804962 RepID=A0A9W8NUS7_9AGAR|nr:MFS transporter [Lentinula detonsa]KAJ3986890.1 MFS transporter [Lentinula detonsa]
MASQDIVDYERKMTRRILWKLDCHVLPPLALLWLANFIDRSNVGNARIAGLETDTHLRGNQFNTVLAVFYVSYLLVEMPSNWILKRMGANRWLPIIVCAWGIVTTLTGLVHNFGGILAIRIVLGACEGGLLPGMILYLSTIYKRHELQLRVGIFYASASLSGAFGGLLATAIIKMDGIGGLAGWRWIFILEGICTVLFCLVAVILLPADIASARFLTSEEREFAVARFNLDLPPKLAQGTDGERNSINIGEKEKPEEYRRDNVSDDLTSPGATQEEEEFEWREVMRGVLDIQTWLTAFAYFGLIVSLYSYSLFLPTIVAGLGYTGSAAQLHTVPPYVPAVVLTVIIAFLSDRLRWRGPFILICLPIAIVGYIIAITAKTNTGRYAAVFLMATGVYPSGPSILSILPNNSNGHYKRATTTALQLAIANCGGFVATFAYTPDQAPRYIRGHTISLCFLILAWVLIVANVSYCLWENKARAEGRRQHNITQYQELWDSGKTRAPIGDRHPDFRFTL